MVCLLPLFHFLYLIRVCLTEELLLLVLSLLMSFDLFMS